jgi:hypothetical protein
MIFKARNYEIFHFDLEYTDDSELTGYIWQSELTRLGVYLGFRNSYTSSSILVADVETLIEWFDQLLHNNSINTKVSIFNNQLYFDLLETKSNSKVIRITYDTTVPVPGIGAYSLSPGAKKEDFSKRTSIECVMDNLEIERIAKKLKSELQIELQIGLSIESKKPIKKV